MSNKEIPFFTQTALLDQYAHSPDPASDPELLEVVIDALRSNPELRTYFFRIGPHPNWAPILWERDFLTTAPEPVKTEQGYELIHWDAQNFLISVANNVPDVVTEHVKAVSGHGVYLKRSIQALRNIPSEIAETVLPVILNWLKDPQIANQVAEEELELMRKFAADRREEPAFALFQALTTPLPSSDTKTYGEVVWHAAAVSVLVVKNYRRKAFEESLILLQELDLPRTVSILEEQLCAALKVEAEVSKDSNYKSSSFWRNAIEETGQDARVEYKDVLLVGLRDSLERWVEEDQEAVIPLLERYLSESYEILRRVGLHLLQHFPNNFRDLVARELLRPENLDDTGIHHEYFMLLQQGYPYLTTTQQELLLSRIVSGPTAEKLQEVAEWANKDQKDRDEYVKSYSKWWTRDRLWMIKEYLQSDAKELLDQLVAEIKEPDHPAFTHWTSGVYTISEVSPVTEDELRRRSPLELMAYLKTWQPHAESRLGPKRESYGSLGRDVAKVVLSDLEKYGDLILDIAAIRSEYATSFLHASSETKLDSNILWDLRLTICENLLADEHVRTNIDRSLEGGWNTFRWAIVSMLEKAVSEDQNNIPKEFLPRIRDLLIILVDDPDPDMESDRPKEGWLGHNDPLTVAINHIRPEALLSLIKYSRLVAPIETEQQPKGFGPDRMEPIVKEVLTRKVDPSNDPSLALHSVFGRELPLLCWLNLNWVEENVDKIFPPGGDEESISFFVAAWDSYVMTYTSVYMEILQLLRPKYEQAIDNVSRGYITKTHLEPVKWFANHLLLEYLEATYDVRSSEGQESLIAKFFAKTPPDARGQAAWALAELCSHNHDKTEKYWPRARVLWHWRIDTASSANHRTDFREEMEGFSHLLLAAPASETIISLWPLIEGMLPYLERSGDWDRIWHNFQEYLAKEVARDSFRVIQFYRLMHDQLVAPIWYYDDEARKILETGAANKESRKETLLLIDKIARSGNYQFNDIYDKYAG